LRSGPALASAALLLASCTVGPDYSRPKIDVPASFAEAAESGGASDTELAAWWTRFHDPLLDELVRRALAQNLDIESAASRIREARAQEIVAGAAALPEVNAQGSATRQRISENAIPVPPGAGSGNGGSGSGGSFGLPGAEFSTFRVGFDASWELDLFGRTRRSVEAARARTGAAIWNRRDLEVTIAAEVAGTYFRLRELQARIILAKAELSRQQRFERLVSARVRGGLVTGQDLEQQRSERAGAAAAIPPLEAEAKAETHALGVLTGDTPEALSERLAVPAPLPAADAAVPPGLPSDLLRRRPDIRSAERGLAASTADVGVAVADLYPRFSLTAAPALVSTALASLLEWGSRSYSIGGSVDWPIFNGHRGRANVDVANARTSEALVAYRKAVLGALQDVEDALARCDSDSRELAHLNDALGTASRAEQIARSRYGGGLVTYSDVLVAQARRIKLEDQVIQTRGALARDTAALFKALGGGWPELASSEAQQ
jgi:NodT family efflux transporter outer membrane factor (OMF) lipoprotein